MIIVKKWKLRVNLSKSKIIVFRNGGYLSRSERWWHDSERIDVVTYYSYLGVVFSSRLCWSKCLETYTFKAVRLVLRLRSIFNKFYFVDTKTAFKIFDCKIKPILLYGSEIWGTSY